MSNEPDTLPRHIRIALATATRAFDDRDLRVFGTFNEDLQPMVDAASAWITALRRDLTDARQETKAARDELATLRLEHESWGAIIDGLRASLATVTRERDEARAKRDVLFGAHMDASFAAGASDAERDLLREQLRKCQYDRDEARRERDELRAALAEAGAVLRDVVAECWDGSEDLDPLCARIEAVAANVAALAGAKS